jgi:TetR/AcrR family transcriptional regulator, mexCD-oprJ operon repressor
MRADGRDQRDRYRHRDHRAGRPHGEGAGEVAATKMGRDQAGSRGAGQDGRITLYGHFRTRADLVDAVLVRTVQQADAILDATDTSGDPAEALARLVASSWQLVHQFRNILLAAQRELPAERIRGVHDRILRRVQSLIEQGQRAGTFRRDMPRQWLITATLLAAFSPQESV